MLLFLYRKPNMLSNERFSNIITTTCLILEVEFGMSEYPVWFIVDFPFYSCRHRVLFVGD